MVGRENHKKQKLHLPLQLLLILFFPSLKKALMMWLMIVSSYSTYTAQQEGSSFCFEHIMINKATDYHTMPDGMARHAV